MNNCKKCGRFTAYAFCKKCYADFPDAEEVDKALKGATKKRGFIITKA